MKKAPIRIIKDSANPEPVELLAKSIVEVSDGFRKLNEASLNRRAIVTLLIDMIPSGQITRTQINLVLDNLPRLKGWYVKEQKQS